MGNIKLNSIFKTVCIASDHAGFILKEEIKNHLIDRSVSIFDMGPFNDASVDYPDYAKKLAKKYPKSAAAITVAIGYDIFDDD